MNLLIIDDNAYSAESLKRFLQIRQPAFKVDFALSIDSAIKQFHESHFDAVIMDLPLEDEAATRGRQTNNLEFMSYAREIGNSPDPHFIVYTARNLTQQERNFVQHNGISVFRKDESVEKLLDWLTLSQNKSHLRASRDDVRLNDIICLFEETVRNRIPLEIRIAQVFIPYLEVLEGHIRDAVNEANCRVTVIFCDPNFSVDQAVKHILDSKELIRESSNQAKILQNLNVLQNLYMRLPDSKQESIEVRLHQGFIGVSLFGMGDIFFVKLNLSGQADNTTPWRVSNKNEKLYASLDAHFEYLRAHSKRLYSGA